MGREIEYIKKVSEITKKSYENVEKQMSELKETIGLTYEEYYENELYTKSRTQQFITGRRIVKKRKTNDKVYHSIEKKSGLNKKQIDKDLATINAKKFAKIKLDVYEKFELYKYEGEDLDNILRLLGRRKELKKSIRKIFIKIDNGQASYSDIEDEAEELYEIIKKIIPDYLYEKHKEILLVYKPDYINKPELLNETVVDMEFTKFLLNFTYQEYVSFGFDGKSIAEKREFVNDIERLKLLRRVNDISKFELLDDKYQAYKLLKKYFGRKMICIQSEKDYWKFKWFCLKLDKVVVKPFFESLGRGVKLVELPKGKALKELYKELCATYKTFIVEELIVAHESIKALNPDSVNTVRMVTYYNGDKTIIHHPFMKIGKKGSFVDNGGQGGILVAVDAETGILSSDGCDENGVIYEYHPDTNIKLKGYQLPNWDKAIATAHELSTKIPGICYIGWDFALNKDGEWIIVEGNARTQFFGQQCTTKIGVRRELFKTLNQPFDM